MRHETEERRRGDLRHLVERLGELVDDDLITISSVGSSLRSTTCSKCKGYGDEILETITIVYKR